MSVFAAVCPGCKKKIGLPRPGSIVGVEDIEVDCPFCGKMVSAKNGFEVAEPKVEEEEFDLLAVN